MICLHLRDGQHPPILKFVLAKKINFETFLILDDILKIFKKIKQGHK